MTGKKILEARRLKGLSQEELSEISRINVRTIQRIENGNNIPRGKTLSLLCSVLDLDIQELLPMPSETPKKPVAETIVSYFFVILLNLIIMSIFGFLTLDSEANANSKLGALFLAVLIPLFIVEKTRQMQPLVRLIKFGSGLLIYLILVTCKHKFLPELLTGFYPSLLLALSVLFYGGNLLSKELQGNT